MKNPLTGFICTCLLVVAGSLPGRAQENKPDAQPAELVAAVPDTAPQQGAPADQPAAPQPATPSQPSATPQTAPDQTPPSPDQEPTVHGRIPELPPPPPKVPDVRRPGEAGWWIGLEGWFPTQQPIFNKGAQSNYTDSSLITMQGRPKEAENVEFGFAVGLHNTLKLNYTDFRAAGDFTTPVDVVAWSQTYTAGTYVSTNYRTQSIRLSYEYLTWPYPVGSRKFRLKTLWQVQYTQIDSTFDSPLEYYDSNGNPVLDTNGIPVKLSAGRYRHIFSPMFGLGTYYYPSRHFRVEFNGSGFGWPHRFSIWDTDGSLNIRVVPHFEIRLGGRAFGFKTSPNASYFLKGIFASAFVGVRWYSNSE